MMLISQRANAQIGHNQSPAHICPICGEDIGRPDARRSVPHLRRYFALIRETFKHWPESHERQFTSPQELRAWLQMKAGHRDHVATIPITGMRKEHAIVLVEAAIRASGSYSMPVPHKEQIAIFRPRSIAFAKLEHLAAVALFQEIEDVIRAESGLDPAELMREQEGAA
jgi:hypothetical protein